MTFDKKDDDNDNVNNDTSHYYLHDLNYDNNVHLFLFNITHFYNIP